MPAEDSEIRRRVRSQGLRGGRARTRGYDPHACHLKEVAPADIGFFRVHRSLRAAVTQAKRDMLSRVPSSRKVASVTAKLTLWDGGN